MFTRVITPIRFAVFSLLLSAQLATAATWEYLVKTYPLMGNDQGLTETLNKLGSLGWELVNCTEGDAQLTCIFKRPAKEG